MKFNQIIFLALLMIDISVSSTACEIDVKASNLKDCENLDLDEDEDEKYCCFVKGEMDGEELNSCIPITESHYKDLDQTKKLIEADFKAKIDILDCKSYYLQVGLINLILLIL